MNEVQENKQGKLIQDLTNIHEGQYLALTDGNILKIVQVQESNVDDSYNLEPVDIENINLDLSSNYDLLQTLVKGTNNAQVDLSTLIIQWLQDYPVQIKAVADDKTTISNLQNSLETANKSVSDLKAKNDELTNEDIQLTNENIQLNKGINDLKAKNGELTNENTQLNKEINDLKAKINPAKPDPSQAKSK